MGDGGADIVDQLFFDQLFAVPDAIEHFPYRNRRDGMLADQAEALRFSAGLGLPSRTDDIAQCFCQNAPLQLASDGDACRAEDVR